MDTTTTIVLQGEKAVADYVLTYGATLVNGSRFNCDLYEIIDADARPILKLPYGESTIVYNNHTIEINYTHHTKPLATCNYPVWKEEVKVTCSHENSKKILLDFLVDARKFVQPGKINKVRTYIMTDGYWSELSRKNKRPLNTIYLDKSIKDPLLQDVKNFQQRRELYLEYGIPYKRNYLFHGPAGCGKSSTIFALASELGYDLAIVNFGLSVDDSVFMKSLSHLPENTMLVLEDIDALFVERKANEHNKTMISFSGLLNALDGLGNREKLITIMTTNYVDRLDNALIRPGRVDYIAHFPYATESQIRMIFEKLVPNQMKSCEQFVRRVSSITNLTTATLQEYLFINRDLPNIMDKIEQLPKMLNERDKLLHPITESSNSYI